MTTLGIAACRPDSDLTRVGRRLNIGPVRRRIAVFAMSLLSASLLLVAGSPAASAAPQASQGYGHFTTFGGGELSTFEGSWNAIAADGHDNLIGLDPSSSGEAKLFAVDPLSGGTPLTSFAVPGIAIDVTVDRSTDAAYFVRHPFEGGGIVRYLSDGAATPTYTLDPGYEIPGVIVSALAVDSATHVLYVAEEGSETIKSFSEAGVLLDTIATPGLNPQRLALAPDGSIYAAQLGGSVVYHFGADGTLLGEVQGAGPIAALAVNPASGILVVATGSALKRFSPSGVLQYESPAGGGPGLTFDGTGERVYQFTGGSIDVYVPATSPGVEAPVVSGITANGAHLSAEVDPGVDPGANPGDPPPAGSVAFFEYSADGGITWSPPTPDQPLGGPETVQENLTGLVANSDYLVRAVAKNSLLSKTSGAIPLHTLLTAPEVETGPAISITSASSELTGTVKTTFGAQTTYHFEYGLTDAYGSRVPVDGEAPAGSSRTPRSVSRPIGGLQPDTTYHFRLVAQNAAGTTNGPDRTFITAATEPPTRGYEQVTPVDKKGGVINSIVGFQAAADGSAVSYTLAAPPSDAPSAVIFTRYLSRRGSDDWLHWSPTDPPVGVTRNTTEVVTQAISSDFTHALVVSNRVLAPGAQEGSGNIYVVDLDTNSYTLVGSAPGWRAYTAMTEFQTEDMFLVGAPDFSWITIVSRRSLLPGAPPVAMYRWTRNGGLTLQSSSTDSIKPPPELTTRWVSDDGNVMYYQHSEGDGAVYRHALDGSTTPVSVAEAGGDVSEGTIVAAELDGCSRDGRYAIFHTRVRLTSDDPPSLNGIWMYRYDSLTADLEFIGQPVAIGAGIVSGVGDDAKTVYFSGDRGGTFAWRNGETHKVTDSNLHLSITFGLQRFASPNGRYLAYVDPQVPAVHLYDAQTQSDVCVSCPANGGSGGSDFGLPGGVRTVSNRTPLVVNDSGLMFFNTAARLLPADHNGSQDVYSYEGGRLSLISPGDGNFTARFADATPDGSVVYFTTDQPLVSRDTDQAVDVYASRLGPVFDQSAPRALECSGEGCQGQNARPPGAVNVGSDTGKGSGSGGERAAIGGIRKLTASARSALAGGGSARLRTVVSGPGTVRVTGTAKIGKKSRVVVASSTKAKSAGPVSIPIALSKGAISALRSRGSLGISLTVHFKDARPKVVKFTLRAASGEKGGRS